MPSILFVEKLKIPSVESGTCIKNYQLSYPVMTSRRIDILLPYWGDLELAKKTVASVLNQSNPNWRLLIFDDCYPSDEPKKYFSSIQDSRVSYYRHPENIGITKNFNYAISRAKADFCTLVGCDDILLPNYVDLVLENIGNADFFQPGVEVINADGIVYLPLVDKVKRLLMPKTTGIYSGEKLATTLCHGNWLYFPSISWKTATVQKHRFNDKYKIAEDLLLELTIIAEGGLLSYNKTPAFQYRRFSESLSSKEKGKGGVRFDEERDVYDIMAKKFNQLGWKKAAFAAKLRASSRLHDAMNR